MKFSNLLRLAVVAVGGCCVAGATSITVLNYSFENPPLTPGSFTTGGIPNWTGGASLWGVFQGAVGSQIFNIPDGVQVAYLYGAGFMFQDLGVAAQSGQTYQLDVFVGIQNGISAGYEVQLLDGANVIADSVGAQSVFGPMQLVTVSGSGTGAGNLGVKLISLSGQPLFDDVQVSTTQSGAAPEPGTFSALGLALTAVAWRRFRR